MNESNVQKQIELVRSLIASPEKRKQYLADPDGYLSSEGITPAPDLKKALIDSLKNLEDEIQSLGSANKFADRASGLFDITDMRMLTSAAVSAVAAVVSAVAAVTTATSAASLAGDR